MKLFLCFLLVSFVHAYVEWPFTSDGNGSLVAKIGIGTPGKHILEYIVANIVLCLVQTLALNLTFYGYCPGLIICSSVGCPGGFNKE
jgi:hypothetical protein